MAYMQQLSEIFGKFKDPLHDIDPKMGIAITAASVITACLLWNYQKSRRYNFPPAPPGIFFVGNALQIRDNVKRLHLMFHDWSKTYGDVFTLNMMGQKHLVVNGREALREVTHQAEDLQDRPVLYRAHYILEFQEDITFGHTSPKWAMMKKSALSALRMYSDGLQRVESFSHHLLGDLLEKFASHNGQPFNPRWEIRDAITFFMSWLTFGDELTKDELMLTRKQSEYIHESINCGGLGPLLEQAHWLRFIPNHCVRVMNEVRKIRHQLYDKRLEDGKASYDPSDIKCVLHSMIKQRSQANLTDDNMKTIMLDFIAAGTDTTSSTLHFFVALMAGHPDIQKKAQQAIDKAIGNRLPLLADKGNLSYIEAIEWETLRYLCTLPVVHRRATRDTTFRGYHIPKDTVLWINIWSMHYDERFWDAPTEFRPERFLDNDGKVVPPDHPNRINIMPFGAGRRLCIGETLARNRLFLFMTAFLQQFTFMPESPDKPPPVNPKELNLGILLLPKDFKIRALPREK